MVTCALAFHFVPFRFIMFHTIDERIPLTLMTKMRANVRARAMEWWSSSRMKHRKVLCTPLCSKWKKGAWATPVLPFHFDTRCIVSRLWLNYFIWSTSDCRQFTFMQIIWQNVNSALEHSMRVKMREKSNRNETNTHTHTHSVRYCERNDYEFSYDNGSNSKRLCHRIDSISVTY